MPLDREHEYVERCHCEAPAVGGCEACGRARCAMHLERGLCNRCTQFIRREMAQRTTTPWLSGGVVGAGGTVALIAAGAAVVSVVALPVGIMAGVAHRWLQRRLLIRKMGPALSASVGELPQVPHDHTRFPEPSNNVPPPGSW